MLELRDDRLFQLLHETGLKYDFENTIEPLTNYDKANNKQIAINYVKDCGFWLPSYWYETKEEARTRYLNDAIKAYEGYLFCKEKNFRRCAAYLLVQHRKFKQNYDKEFK